MERFKFYQDCKQTVWVRAHFSIEAENYEVALMRANELRESDIPNSTDTDLEFEECETLYETSEEMSVEENGGQPTLEIYTGKGEFICDNMPVEKAG